MATVPEVCCEELGIAIELAKESGRVELGWRTETMHSDSETNFPESSNSVQAVGIRDIQGTQSGHLMCPCHPYLTLLSIPVHSTCPFMGVRFHHRQTNKSEVKRPPT